MAYGLSNGAMTSHDPRSCCEAVQSAILATAWLLHYRMHSYTISNL